MSREHCQTESRRLGETTSLKGIGRILRSKHPVLKALWTVCTIIFVFLALYQAVLLLLNYFSYPEITDLDERSVNLLSDKTVILPHITVCNLNPLSERANFEGYIAGGRDLIEEHYNNSAEQDLLRRTLMKTRSYFTVLGREEAKRIGHTQEEFIASCKVLLLHGLDLDEEDCSLLANVSLFQHSKYFNCYTVAMHQPTAINQIVGYSLTLHLANYQLGTHWSTLLATQRKQQLGALLAIHAPNTYPLFIEEGHIIAPGTHVNVRYSLQQRDRLPAPHGNCQTSEKFMRDFGVDVNTSIHYEYTKPMCVSVGLEHYIMEECGCVDVTLMQILDTGKLPVCGEFNPGLERARRVVVEKLMCARDARKAHLQEMIQACHDPCHQLLYIPEISESMWPPSPVAPNFYFELVSGRPYEKHYDAIRAVIAPRSNSTATSSQELASLEALMRQNFVNLDVFLGRLRKLDIIDSPKLTRTTLMSQLGGTLNLWAGITFVLLIEFIEYLLRMLVLPPDS